MKTYPQTSEFVALKGFDLIGYTVQSCGVDMGDLFVVIGGWNPEKKRAMRKVTLYNDDGFVRNLPDLIMGRYDHACAGFQDINGDMVGVILFYS